MKAAQSIISYLIKIILIFLVKALSQVTKLIAVVLYEELKVKHLINIKDTLQLSITIYIDGIAKQLIIKENLF